MTRKVALVGLGRMGMPAAEKFIRDGWDVTGCARTSATMEKFRAIGGTAAAGPREAARAAATIIVLVVDGKQVIDVVTGPGGVLEGAAGGSTVIVMSTILRDQLEYVAEACAGRNVNLIDAPVTGGPKRMADGTLTLIVSGPRDLVEKNREVLEAMGHIVHVGEKPGMGQSVKHCNQLMVVATHAALMETILLARKLGVDPRDACDVIGNGFIGSDFSRFMADSVLNQTPSPSNLGQVTKDLNIVVDTARQLKLPLLVTTATAQYFLAAEGKSMQDREGAALYEIVEKMNDPEV